MVVDGQVVGGRYRLVRQLGAGGMGSIWIAEHLAMGTNVALKVIATQWKEHPVALARFRREARAAAELRSPHIVQILDYDVDPGVGPFMIMELLEGEDLGARLARRGALSPRELAPIALQVGKALARAHRAGVVHRDLKPENVFLLRDVDGSEYVKLLDFGVAKVQPKGLAGEFQTEAGTLVGTLSRMSPEQIGGQVVDHRADIWAFGLFAFQALVGFAAVDDSLPMGQLVLQISSAPMPVASHFNPNVTAGFDAWFRKATQVDPARRFQCALEAATELAEVCRSHDAGAAAADLPAPRRDPPTERFPDMPDARSHDSADPVLQLHGAASLHPSAGFWVLQEGAAAGPVTSSAVLRSLKEGSIFLDALVWSPQRPHWRPVRESMPGIAPSVLPSGDGTLPPPGRWPGGH